jgi:5'-3' exonuclease
VAPASVPDYLALVGDSADGFPGLPGWGARSAAAVLARYGRLEAIPHDPARWAVRPRGAERLAAALNAQRELAYLFRRLATLVVDAPVSGSVDDLAWTGPRADFGPVCAALDAPELSRRAEALASGRRGSTSSRSGRTD